MKRKFLFLLGFCAATNFLFGSPVDPTVAKFETAIEDHPFFVRVELAALPRKMRMDPPADLLTLPLNEGFRVSMRAEFMKESFAKKLVALRQAKLKIAEYPGSPSWMFKITDEGGKELRFEILLSVESNLIHYNGVWYECDPKIVRAFTFELMAEMQKAIADEWSAQRRNL